MKTQLVCPLPKHPSKRNIIEEDETRPISLLETLDKWIQRAVYNHANVYVKYNEKQIGYQKSCDHHTTTLSEHLYKNRHKFNVVVFTDIAKAFDSVPIPELTHVIWNSNMPPVYKRAITSFAKDRRFKVELRSPDNKIVSSKWKRQLYGTPHGSVLEPLL